ncbi:MAG: SAM-dependent chlorinase/fluorinase [Pseudomonadota bacterium]
MPPLITLTTDFGLSDEYVGVMKGVIHSHCPDAVIVDLTHNVRPQDIRQAAIILAASYRFFPKGSIHLIVVDPGVGTSRRIVLLQTDKQLFLLPDNGTATLLPPPEAAYEVTEKHLFLSPVSRTFHGRDIFAPVAAHLACGLLPEQTGCRIDPDSLVRLPFPPLQKKGKRLRGSVIDIDHFGNLITNIDRKTAENFFPDSVHRLIVSIGSLSLQGISSSYGSVLPGRPVALFGSRDYLEISINRGNCAQTMQVKLDSNVYLSIQ